MRQGQLSASLIVIGDEILQGDVSDANVHPTAELLASEGVPLDRVVIIGDAEPEIVDALRDELTRNRPRVILTSGGIGPTVDDVTYRSVATCLGVPTAPHADLLTGVEAAIEWHREHGFPVTDAFVSSMMRLADVPVGARVHRYRTWIAGVELPVDGGINSPNGAVVVMLPGAPSQYQAILEEVVKPRLLAGRGVPAYVMDVEHRFPESFLSVCIDELHKAHPEISIGSYPGEPMVVRLRGPRPDVLAAREKLASYLAELEASDAAPRVKRMWMTWQEERRTE